MSLLREKIIRVLLENAFIALFEFYCNHSDQAAKIRIESEEAAVPVAVGDRYGGNGTRRSACADWLNQHRKHMIEEYRDRGIV